MNARLSRPLALTALLVVLAACGQTPAPVVTHDVTVNVALQPAALRPLGVPAGVDQATVSIFDGSTQLQFDVDGNVVASGGQPITFDANGGSRTVKLPAGVNYRVDVSVTKGAFEDAWGSQQTGELTGDVTVKPALTPIIDKVSLSTSVTPLLAKHRYPLLLKVTAPDGSSIVPTTGYTVSAYGVTGTTDATIDNTSKLGAQVVFGMLGGTVTLHTTVTGMDKTHNPAHAFTADSPAYSVATWDGSINADLTPPAVTAASFGTGTLSVTASDATGVTHVSVYRDAVELVADYDLPTPVAGAATVTVPPLAGKDFADGSGLTVYASDAAGNESAGFSVTVLP